MAGPSNNRQEDPKLERYRKALEENPSSRYFAPLADALRKQGQLQEAIQIAEQGVKRNPRYESGLVVLAKSYLENEQLQEALEQFQVVTRLNPENVNAQKAIAEIYDNLGYHREAMQAYTNVTVLDPRDQNAQQRLELLEATAPQQESQETPTSQPPEHSTSEHSRVEKTEEEKTEELSPIKTEEQSASPQDAEEFLTEPVPEKIEPETVESDRNTDRIEGVVITEPGKGQKMPLFNEPPPDADAATAPPPDESKKSEAYDQKEPESDFPEPVYQQGPPEEKQTGPEPSNREQQEPPKTESSAKTGQPSEELEEKYLDTFFNGVKPQNLSIAAGENSSETSPFEPLSSPRFQVKIEKSNGGRMFWKQGHYQEALKIIAQDLWEAPYDQELREEFLKACQAMDRSPEAVLDEVIVLEDEKRKERQESAEKEGSAPEPSAPGEQKPDTPDTPSEEELESRQKVQTLRAYLARIRKDKEKMT